MREGLAEVYLLRHGESAANAQGLFTGVLDPSLTELGREEARNAARLLRDQEVRPARVFTSALHRTIETVGEMRGILELPDRSEVDWRLDERNYGALTGLSKAEVIREAGYERFHLWRRSFDVAPPPMAASRLDELRHRPPFDVLPSPALTSTESLADVVRRITPFVEDLLLPSLGSDAPLLVVAHGNSLRALLFIVQHLTKQQVEELNIPTGHPLRCVFALTGGVPVLRSAAYLDPEGAATAADALASHGGT